MVGTVGAWATVMLLWGGSRSDVGWTPLGWIMCGGISGAIIGTVVAMGAWWRSRRSAARRAVSDSSESCDVDAVLKREGLMMLRTAIAGLVGVLVGAGIVTALTGHRRVVRARRFEVVDGGRAHATLGIDESGTIALSLHGRSAGPRARLWVRERGEGGLSLSYRDGSSAVELAAGPLNSTLTLGDQYGLRGVKLGVLGREQNRVAELSLASTEGQVMLGVSPCGMPGLCLRDGEGRARALIGATRTRRNSPDPADIEQRPESSLVLSDEDGKVLWEAP
jgi:hypothetical protein